MLNSGVGVLFILPHNDHIHLGMLGPDIGIITQAWADIGVESKSLAGGDIERLKAPALGRGDGGLEKNLGAPQRFPSRRLNPSRISPQINLLPNLNLLDLQPGPSPLQNGQCGLHDFWTNAVAAGDRDGSVL